MTETTSEFSIVIYNEPDFEFFKENFGTLLKTLSFLKTKLCLNCIEYNDKFAYKDKFIHYYRYHFLGKLDLVIRVDSKLEISK